MTEITDYRDLLRKYIDHIGMVEGSVFLERGHRAESANCGVLFADEEWAELQMLAKHEP